MISRTCTWISFAMQAPSSHMYIITIRSKREHKYSMWFLGPRIKNIILNILCQSNRYELKFSLKIYFMHLTIIFKWQAPNGNIFLVIPKIGDRARGSLVRECGPWSANHTSRTKSPDNFRKMMRILITFYLFFIILDISNNNNNYNTVLLF